MLPTAFQEAGTQLVDHDVLAKKIHYEQPISYATHGYKIIRQAAQNKPLCFRRLCGLIAR